MRSGFRSRTPECNAARQFAIHREWDGVRTPATAARSCAKRENMLPRFELPIGAARPRSAAGCLQGERDHHGPVASLIAKKIEGCVETLETSLRRSEVWDKARCKTPCAFAGSIAFPPAMQLGLDSRRNCRR